MRRIVASGYKHCVESPGKSFTGSKGVVYQWFPDRPLGEGGYGQVFEATTVDGQLLAVKRVGLRRQSTVHWYAEARLAEREIRVSALLPRDTRDNVLPVLDDLLGDDELLLVMPRADHSLADRLAKGPRLDEAEVKGLLLDLAAGLRLLADHSVVHRDIKPGNILWWNERWVLADLGIARILDEDTSTFTWAGTGTHEWWAPELFDRQPAKVSTDLYALGCVAFAALTGRPPFTDEDLAQAHRTQTPDLLPIGDAALDRTVRRLLSKKPGARPTDARMVQQMLELRGTLGPDQNALLRAAARTASRDDERARLANLNRERDAQVQDALAALDAIGDDVLARAAEVLPSSTLLRQHDTLFLTVPEADARLVLQTGEPSGRPDELLIGIVRVDFLDASERRQSYVANLICTYADGRAHWLLLKFAHNYIAKARLPLGPRRADTNAGLSLPNLDALLPSRGRSVVPPVIVEQTPLTAQSLLAELTAELEAPND